MQTLIRYIIGSAMCVLVVGCLDAQCIADVAASIEVAPAEREAQFLADLLSKMSLEEKVGQLVQLKPERKDGETTPELQKLLGQGLVGSLIGLEGAEATRKFQTNAVAASRLHIPLLIGSDVIHGYRTIFPVPLASACSWDPEAVEAAERIAAIEATSSGLNWTFAPMVDIARDPRWGRIVEGAGEDPYLGSVMAAARVGGFQGDDLRKHDSILACAKHFVAYGAAEGGRDYNTSEVSDRTMLETYLPPFRAAAEAGVGSVMSAFCDIAGIPATANEALVRGTLKRRWKWDGFVVSDWESVKELQAHGVAGSMADAARLALIAGVDIDMASRCYLENAVRLVRDGQVTERVVNEAAMRVLRAKYRLGLFDDPCRGSDPERERQTILSPANRAKARELAGRSIVLLDNVNHTLPLDRNASRFALIGALANDPQSTIGPWSVSGKPADAVTILAGLRAAAGEDRVAYAPGYDLKDLSAGDIDEAVRIASQAESVIVVLGEAEWMSGEAKSRASIELPANQRALFEALQKIGKPLIVLMVNGRPMAIPEVHEHAAAVLETWYLGVEMGNAVADVLFGDVNPGGKLAATFPASTGQIPIYYNHHSTGRPEDPANQWTSKYIDFTTSPLYCFGHGRSYTTFEYSDFTISPEVRAGGTVQVSFRLKNSGDRSGDEVAQVYIRDPVASIARPVKELKGFRRVTLAPGEQKTLRFEIPASLLGFYGADLKPMLEAGTIQVMIGGSSEDIRLRGQFDIQGERAECAEPGTVFTKSTVE